MNPQLMERLIAAGAISATVLTACAIGSGLSGVISAKNTVTLCDLAEVIMLAPLLVAMVNSALPERSLVNP